MNCPNCQAVNREGAAFCISCGSKLVGAAPVAEPPSPVFEPPPEPLPVATPLAAATSLAAATPLAVSALLDGESIVITDVNMSFGAMIRFMVKWSLAAIPAVIILTAVFTLITFLLGGSLSSLLFLF
ncbi:MAG: zinc ribbon domain-containing protein [Chloroflexota bacterium]